MAQHWSEGVGTLRFTSREYQQELIEIGRTDNLLACPPEQAANFIALKLLQEMAYQIRPPSRKKSVYLTLAHKLKIREVELCQLTDLHVASYSGHKHVHHLHTSDEKQEESVPASVCEDEHCLCSDSRYLASKRKFIESNHVLIMVSSVFDDMLESGLLEMSQINLIIIEECHSVVSDKHLQKIMAVYTEHKKKVLGAENVPRIIAFTYPLFTQNSLFDYNNLDSVTVNIKKDYDDFINHRSEFYHQWDSNGFNFDQSDESTVNTPVKSISPCYNKRNEKSACNKDSANEALSTFMEPVILEEEESEDFQKMTDFNYWKMDIPSFVDVPELGKKIQRLSIYDKLEYQLEKLEAMLCCKVDMSPDIVGLKKITGKPREVLLESQSENADNYLCSKGKMLKHYMKVTAFNALVFLEDHRYDPLEIYGDDAFGDELRAIPDPVIEPKDLLLQFLHVLDQAGPYAADKAAFVLLVKIEKLKVKTPYERHFLLLCLATSVFIQIRSAAESVFEKCTSEYDKIRKFTSPKFLRLMDIFRLFKPKNQEVDANGSVANKCQPTYNLRDSSPPNNCDEKSNLKIDNSIEIGENFANKVIVDDDIIKVYLDKESNGAIDKQCVKSCDMNSSQTVISESNLHPNSQIKSEHLINQLDSCDFQVLQHRLQAECVKYTETGENEAGKCDKFNTNNKHETSDPTVEIFTEEHSTNSNAPNLINGCENNPISLSSAGAEKEVSCEIMDADIPDESDGSTSKNKGEIAMPTSTPHKSVTFDVENKENFKDTNNVVVDDICYTKGAFETMMKSNSGLYKTVEKPSNKSGDHLASNKENHVLETCADITKQHVESYSYKISPKKKLNDAGAKKGRREHRPHNWNDPDSLCGLIFVDEPLMAKILYSLIYEYTRQDPELQFINAQFTVDKTADPQVEPKEAENEHKLQEEVLRRFRTHECNLLIGTSVLEDGMDLPKCNLVIRWDPPRGYRCYAQCRSRARAPKSLYALMAPEHPEKLVTVLAHYTYIERMLVRKCRWTEPGPTEEARATDFTPLILPYRPVQQAVTLSQAVQLVNRYCAKLPSDTFTRLVPLWTIEEITYRGHNLYVCSVRLPINSPMKYQIVGHPMPSKVLARRVAALQVCRALHLSGELDDNLLPIGKESFRALEPDWVHMSPYSDNAQLNTDEPRPGTTKRKQYYYKRVAQSLTGCRPKLGSPCLAYEIRCHLAVPLPERHNTRGRKLHPPENYPEGFCILTSKPIHEIPVFPLFTRSGEVQVQLVKMSIQVVMNKRRYKLIHRFMKYTFKEVLRIHNHLMVFNPAKGRKNNYYVVPTTKVTNPDGTSSVIIDWEFLELIYEHTTMNKNMLLHDHNTISMLEPIDEKINSDCENTDKLTSSENAEEVVKDIANDTSNAVDVVESDSQVIEKLENTSEPIDQNVEAVSKATLDNTNNVEDAKPDKKDIANNVEDGKPDARDITNNVQDAKPDTKDITNNVEDTKPDKKDIANNVEDGKPDARDITNNVEDAKPDKKDIANNVEDGKPDARDITNKIEDTKPDTKDNAKEPVENSTEVSESNDKSKTHNPVSTTDGKLVKLEDLGEDMLEDTWKGQENKVSSVKWDEIDENENTSADDKKISSQDCVSVAEEPEEMPNPYLAPGQLFQFDFEKYRDAVVTPWYRNQNQPQYFYVAEICWHLTPQSAFPSTAHPSFMHYYHTKYGVTITQVKQPLLDVDHTSARLNLLTPRFVNRKGVALPTSSERTKRAKRELLEQKQILVPELCCTHPFRGALWRAAVTLPCVLYRINSLLLADEIRRSVAVRVSLGKAHSDDSTWPPLDFGWSLADVLKDKVDSLQLKEQTLEGTASLKEVDGTLSNEDKTSAANEKDSPENKNHEDLKTTEEAAGNCDGEIAADDKVSEKESLNESGDLFEVGTWSNEMASTIQVGDDLYSKLPANVTMCPSNPDDSIWNSTIPQGGSIYNQTRQRKFSVAGSDLSYVSSDMDMSNEEAYSEEEDEVDNKEQERGGIRIEFKSGNEAEAIDIPPSIEELAPEDQDDLEAKKLEEEASVNAFNGFFYKQDTGDDDPSMKTYIENYQLAIMSNEEDIVKNGTLVKYTDALTNIKLKDYSENIPFYTPKHDSHRHINKRIDYLVHNVRNNIAKVEVSDNGLPKIDSKTPDEDTKSPSCLDSVSNKMDSDALIKIIDTESNTPDSTKEKWQQIEAQKTDEDLTNPFPDIYEKALSKKEILNLFQDMFPYENKPSDDEFEDASKNDYLLKAGGIDLEDLEDSKRRILNEIKASMSKEEWRKYNFFAMKDFHKDDTFESDYEDIRAKTRLEKSLREEKTHVEPTLGQVETTKSFTFDFQPDLKKHPGPSPSVILQALTMSNANDGINLERLETVGDSFLKYAVTVYLYCSYPNIHEGKLSYLRSKQVSNLNLYRLGRRRHLGSRMVACKFEPHDNWLPPCHKVPAHLERALIHTHIPSSLWNVADMPSLHRMSKEEVEQLVYERVMQHHIKSGDESKESFASSGTPVRKLNDLCPIHGTINQDKTDTKETNWEDCLCPVVEEDVLPSTTTRELDHTLEEVPCFVPYNLITQHSIPDKSIADCVEALIGAYLIECGPRGALLFMAWLGMKVLPKHEVLLDPSNPFVKMMEEALVRNNKASKDKSKKTRTKSSDNILPESKDGKVSLDDNVKDLSRVESEVSCDVPCAKEKTQLSSNENSSDIKTDLIKKKSKKKKRKNKASSTEDIDQNIVKNVQNCTEDNKHIKKLPRKRRKGKKESATENDEIISVCAEQSKEEISNNKSSNDDVVVEAKTNDLQLDIDACNDDESVLNNSDDGFESTEDEEEEDNSSVNSCGEESDWSTIESDVEDVWCSEDNEPGTLLPYKNKDGQWVQVIFGQLEAPPSPLLRYVPDPDGELTQMLSGYEELERTLNYRFNDRCYLLQAMTHASHTHNRLTDCYQRLEFLGDAVLDYLITRQLYEDPRRHSPGPLTDLRSALVNNTIFASLAVRHGMHKFFRHLSPGLNEVLARFVKIQEENGHSISEEHYLIQEDECEQAEDVEVPKALGDLFESVAGAIFLDSGMSLDAVWKVYYALMHKEMELFSETVPKSPVRELLEMEPETTKFGKPEKLADGRRVRVTVEVLGVGAFKGVGRNFRIAKCTAAKCALRHLNLLKGNTSGAKNNLRK